MAIVGWLTDNYSYSERVFNLGVKLAAILSIPIYYLMSTNVLSLVLISQSSIIIISAMVLCNRNYAMAKPANGQVTTVSMGYNLASTIIG
ncbi:hypothetical protein, partial [Tepidimonas fonticaldi]|uniref:hypothetical protein n=1 Tax=Tepidimonas fonticaldi TaxID=1101373 RepID=UPI001E3DE7BC